MSLEDEVSVTLNDDIPFLKIVSFYDSDVKVKRGRKRIALIVSHLDRKEPS